MCPYKTWPMNSMSLYGFVIFLQKKKSELVQDVEAYDKYIEDLEKVITDLNVSS